MTYLRTLFNRYPKLLISLLIASVVCATHINTLKNGFIWDDEEMVVGNPMIHSLHNIDQIFGSGPFSEKWWTSRFYRPIQTLTYAIDYSIWELDPTGYHLTSVLIHTTSAVLVFILLYGLLNNLAISSLAALWWGIHPINIESIAYVSGRGDALFLLFCLAAWLCWKRALTHHSVWYLIAFSLWAMGILSKENALPLPLIAAAYLWIYRDKFDRETIKNNLIGTIGITTIYVLIRLAMLHNISSTTLSWIASAPLLDRILTVPYILVTYFRLWFIPYPLHMEYHYVADSIFTIYVWVGLPLLGALFYAFLKLVNRKHFYFFSAVIFLGLLPVYNVALPLAATLREHWFYLSGIGCAALSLLSIETLITRYAIPYKWVAISAVILLLPYIGLTVQRNAQWGNPLTFYEHDLQFETQSFLLHNNLGVEYFRRQNFEKAKDSFINAIQASPKEGYGTAHNNYGVILENEGHLQDAINEFQLSITLSNYELAYGNLARILLQQNQPKNAIKILTNGIKTSPYNSQLWYFLGIAYARTNQIPHAIETLQHLEMMTPNYMKTRDILTWLRTQPTTPTP